MSTWAQVVESTWCVAGMSSFCSLVCENAIARDEKLQQDIGAAAKKTACG